MGTEVPKKGMKLKRKREENRAQFAARVANSQQGWTSANDLYKLIDKRHKLTKTELRNFRAHCTMAGKKGLCGYQPGEKGGGGQPARFGPKSLKMPMEIRMLDWPNRALNECSAGQLLKFKYELSREFVMEKLETLLYERRLAHRQNDGVKGFIHYLLVDCIGLKEEEADLFDLLMQADEA